MVELVKTLQARGVALAIALHLDGDELLVLLEDEIHLVIAEDGQERVGSKSVTARVKTRFNWNASSTIAVTQKFFSLQAVADHRMVSHSGPTNLLVFVPDTFTQMDIQQVYLLQGKKGNLSALLNMWQKRDHIRKNMDGTYSKTENFILKYGHYGTPTAAQVLIKN